jgi:hypothetical protein
VAWEPRYTCVSCAVDACKIYLLNPYDKFAVTIKQSHLIVGHIPREHSKICHYFIKRGVIQFNVTDTQKLRSPIPEGGLEIHGLLIFVGHTKDTAKLDALIQSY